MNAIAECLIPTLRFSEFTELWCKKKLGDISTLVTSGSRDWSQYYSNAGDKFVRMTNLSRTGIDLLLEDMRYVKLPENSKDGLRTSLQQGDILISITAELGKIGWIPSNFGTAYINQHTALVRTNNKECSKFVAYLISSAKMNKKINRLNDSGAKSGLNLSTIRSFDFLAPSNNEQQKIANFLTSIDTKIQQLKRKHTLMQKYKKGLMQQLFSQQVRFKNDDGRDYHDWEERRLDSVLTFFPTNSYSRSLLNYEFGAVRNIHYGDIHTKFCSSFKLENEKVPLINSDVNLSKVKADCFCREGDVIIADASEDYKDIGKAIQILGLNGEETLAGLHTYLGRDLNQVTVNGFIGYALQTWGVRLQIMKLATGVSVLGITKGNLGSVTFPLPKSKGEQKKIVEFLYEIDKKVQGINSQIKKAENFKKGLLQQIFV